MGFSRALISWYQKNKRILPFRKTRDPYRIWLSEIIFQQTRISQGLPYYERFVKLFPTVHHLAKAPEDAVMKAWQGLGYYSRARNLHHTAIHISKELKGEFPDEFEEIKKLKGIGDYTAGAIASIAFNKPHAVVDGNVFRVLSRYFGIKTPVDSIVGKRVFARKAEKLLDQKNPGTFNQAVMEFGALQCVPVNPDCTRCLLKRSCRAFLNKQVDRLPVRSKKVKTRTRFFNYLVVSDKGKIGIRKRTGNDIWQNLYDFPMIESKQALTIHKMQKLVPVPIKSFSKPYKHVLSHQVILAWFWEIEHTKKLEGPAFEKTIYITDNQLNKFAFPRLIERYLNEKTT